MLANSLLTGSSFINPLFGSRGNHDNDIAVRKKHRPTTKPRSIAATCIWLGLIRGSLEVPPLRCAPTPSPLPADRMRPASAGGRGPHRRCADPIRFNLTQKFSRRDPPGGGGGRLLDFPKHFFTGYCILSNFFLVGIVHHPVFILITFVHFFLVSCATFSKSFP